MPLSVSSPGDHLRAWHDLNVDYWVEELPEVDPPGELESRSELDSDGTMERGGLLAVDGGAALGAAVYTLSLLEDLDEAYMWLFVPKPLRRQGLGRRLLEAARDTVAAAGRHHVRGDARTDGAGAGFAELIGARSTQLDMGSLLDVTAIDGPRLDLLAAAPDGYSLVHWRDRCPDDLVDQVSLPRVAMNDAPKGDDPGDDWTWDAWREREREARHARWGVRSHVTAALSRDSSELAGFTELLINERPTTAMQEDTAVLPAHRGHGLGIAVKAANLIRLRMDEPRISKVLTWNAESNRHMRAVNERLGFQVLHTWHALSLKS